MTISGKKMKSLEAAISFLKELQQQPWPGVKCDCYFQFDPNPIEKYSERPMQEINMTCFSCLKSNILGVCFIVRRLICKFSLSDTKISQNNSYCRI